jgi:hypothetical protein
VALLDTPVVVRNEQETKVPVVEVVPLLYVHSGADAFAIIDIGIVMHIHDLATTLQSLSECSLPEGTRKDKTTNDAIKTT